MFEKKLFILKKGVNKKYLSSFFPPEIDAVENLYLTTARVKQVTRPSMDGRCVKYWGPSNMSNSYIAAQGVG